MTNPKFDFKFSVSNSTGIVTEYPKTANWNIFEIVIKSKTRIEITGSIHKYWNNGTNENDFKLTDLKEAIKNFCNDFDILPSEALIINLEFGVNIKPRINASEILESVICFKNKRPLRPYEGNDEQFYFMEFKSGNNYLKIYDKGKQYKTDNTLRIEFKVMRSMGYTLNDLTNKKVIKVLGSKLMQFYKNVVFDDRTINPVLLTKKERELYIKLQNPNNWVIDKGKKYTTTYRNEQRFIAIVKKNGKQNIYNHLETLISQKLKELVNDSCINLLSKYNRKTLQPSLCLSCGKDISEQKQGSKFCSPKFVGEAAAHQCRNKNSNPRNNRERSIKKIESLGTLFDIRPFCKAI